MLLFSSASAGTGSQVELSRNHSTDLIIQVMAGSYIGDGVRVFGSVTGRELVSLPGFNVTGSTNSPTIFTFPAGNYIIPNVGGMFIEARVSGSGSVFGNAVTR